MLRSYKIATVPIGTKLFYLLAVLFAAGVCIGVWVADREIVNILLEGYAEVQTVEAAADNFFYTLSADAVLLFAVFVMGFSAVGIPVISIVPLFKGLGVGAAASALYRADPSFLGIVKSIAGFSLTTAVCSAVLIFASVSALRMSAGFFSHLIGRCETDLSGEGKKYGLKFLLFAVIMVINAVADTLLSVLLH